MADTHRLINKGTQDEIQELQYFLLSYGFTDDSGNKVSLDGKFGPATKQALRKFQEKQGLTADSKAGPDTVRAMVKYGEETDIPSEVVAEPEAKPAMGNLSALPTVTPTTQTATKKVAEPIQTAPKMGEPKPKVDPAAAARMKALKDMQAKRAAQKSAQGATPTPAFDDNRAAPAVARPVKTTPTAKPVATAPTPRPVEEPPADTEMRPTNPEAEKNAEKSAEEPQVSTDHATIYSKGEEKVPAPAASPNQMAVDQTNKALDDWVKVYEPLKARDIQPVKTFGAMLKNLKDIYSTGQKAINSDPNLQARWKKIVADVTTYHSNPDNKKQVNEALILADELYENWFSDKAKEFAAKAKEVGSNLLKPRAAQDRRTTKNKQEKPASMSVPNMAGRRTNIRKTVDKSQNVEQAKITDRVTTIVKQKLNDLGYDPNDVPGNPELAKVYGDIGKTIESIQAIVKQYEQKGRHADLVNMKEQFNTLQTQLSTYTKG
jgi:peptidoglycan hydrolase-like protein with peptidoglycan-binding domain